LRRLVQLGLLLLLQSCATPAPEAGGFAAPPDEGAHAQAVWQKRCGRCHRRIQPGSESRRELERALARHKKRVRLTESEWRALITFLAEGDDD
jgi:hypothetical protein